MRDIREVRWVGGLLIYSHPSALQSYCPSQAGTGDVNQACTTAISYSEVPVLTRLIEFS